MVDGWTKWGFLLLRAGLQRAQDSRKQPTCCLLPRLMPKLCEVPEILGSSGQMPGRVDCFSVGLGVDLGIQVWPGLFTPKPMLI